MVIWSGKPSGRSGDQARKRGLRTSSPPRRGSQRSIVYGPVPGSAGAFDRPARAPGGNDEQGMELVQEVGVRPGQMEGDRPRRRVGLDPVREIAAFGSERAREGGASVHRAAPGMALKLVVEARIAEGEQARERHADVLGRDGRSVGEAEVRAQPEAIRPAVGAWLGHVAGEVGHERRARRAAGSPVGDQAVVDE